MPKIYNNTNLTGIQYWNEKITFPTQRSLSGWATRKIEYLQTKAYLRMHSLLALNLSHVMAAAMPIFALLDTLASPFKALYFAAKLDGQGVKEELVNAIKHLALTFFSIPAAFCSIRKPRSVYHSPETWKNIKADKFAKDLIAKEKEFRGESDEITKESLSKAIRVSLPSILASEVAAKRVERIIEAIVEELKTDSEDSDIIAEHYITWFSKFILECQNEGLPLEKVDDTFFELMIALVKLRMPTTRITLMEKIVNEYSKGKIVAQDFKNALEKLEKERAEKIEHYLDNLAKQKEIVLENKKKEIEKKKELYLNAEEEAQAVEKLANVMVKFTVLTESLEQKVQSIFSPSKQKTVNLKKEIENILPKLSAYKEDPTTAPDSGTLKLCQKVVKQKEQMRKKADGMKKSLENAEESLQQLIEESKKSANEPLVSEEELQSKYPAYTSSHFSYVPLYLGLQYFGSDEDEKFQDLFSLVKNARFKDTNYYGHLMKFLIGLGSVEKPVAAKAIETLIDFSKNDDKKLNRTLRTLKNGNILLKLGETERFSSLVTNTESKTKLDSEILIAQLFGEKFDLSDVEKYQGEKGLKALVEDYEKTFAGFRDPIAIMTYYSTLSNLPEKQRKPAIESLTTYVKYVLEGEGVLRQKRHDVSLNPHLKTMYEKYPEIKEAWENTKMVKATDIDPKLSATTMKHYTIGETEDPCDLLMMSTEVTKSCMHIAGRPNKARGQLGHMLDGKTHPVVIKNDKGSIVARMLMRVLEDEKKKKPILVLDYLYSSSTSPEIKKEQKKLLIEFCRKKAAEMDLDLVTIQPKGKGYGPVKSYGSPGAYEHVNTFDKAEYKKVYPDGMTNGNYIIPTAFAV